MRSGVLLMTTLVAAGCTVPGGSGGGGGNAGLGGGGALPVCDAGYATPKLCVADGLQPNGPNVEIVQREGFGVTASAEFAQQTHPTHRAHCTVGNCEVRHFGGGEGGGCGSPYCGGSAGGLSVAVGPSVFTLIENVFTLSRSYSGSKNGGDWDGGEVVTVMADGGPSIPAFSATLIAPEPIARLGFKIPRSVPLLAPLPISWTPGAGTFVIAATTQRYVHPSYPNLWWQAEIRCTVEASTGSFTIPAPLMGELGTTGGVEVRAFRTNSVEVDAGVGWPVRISAETIGVLPRPLELTCP